MDVPGSDAELASADWRAWQFALLVDSVTEYAIFLLEPDGTVASWNPGAERIKGYEASEIIGRHFSVFYTDADRARGHPANELEIAEREGRYEEEGWRVRKDGSRFWASVVITAVRDRGGTLVAFGKVTRDLSERREAEERLRANAAELEAANRELLQFRQLVEHVRDYAIYLVDPRGSVVTWNTGAANIKGYTEEEIIGRHFSLFYTEEDRASGRPGRDLEIAARDGHVQEEAWRLRKDGTRFWADNLLTAVRDDHGALLGYAKVTRDLTERRRADAELRAAHDRLRRSNEELERFAMVAAHDLSSPLTTVEGFIRLLREVLPEDASPKVAEYMRHISASSARMTDLIDRLLAYARAGEGRPVRRPVDLALAADHVVADLAATIGEREANVVLDLDGAPPVLADGGDVEMVLRNLISNAIKFGAPTAPQIRVDWQAEDDGEKVRVAVTDDGAGIAAGDQERIFRAFERLPSPTDARGTGLGLAICERIVERSGGTMGVRSAPGAGSCFWFTLPAARDRTQAGSASPAP